LQIELASAGQDCVAAVTIPMIAWFADYLALRVPQPSGPVLLGIEDALRQRLVRLVQQTVLGKHLLGLPNRQPLLN
jgi:hypothetical protein